MSYFRFWGKTGQEDHASGYHLLPYHCLDVAAVGKLILDERHDLRDCLARIGKCDPNSLTRLIVYFLALHDCGKFSDCFQLKRSDISARLQRDDGGRKGFVNIRHDEAGQVLMREQGQLFGRLWRGSSGSRNEVLLTRILLQPFLWHHGKPGTSLSGPANRYFSDPSSLAAAEFMRDVSSLFMIDTLPVGNLSCSDARQLSWWLAGLTILCDWIGSNTRFFKLISQPVPLKEYWVTAQANARRGIEQSGLLPKEAGGILPLDRLLPTPTKSVVSARSLQAAAIARPITTGPQLFILEDIPGSGKTEAAFILANKLMITGGATGFYFALPTMATANAMYHRIHSVYRRFFAAKSEPSLVLSHSAREMVNKFRISVQRSLGSPYGDKTDSAEATCSAWLADNRKKALLADVGVGTIDQALLAVLPNKHQSLRLLGLVGKILIVDEVHACDTYVARLLQVLLRFHSRSGGSAILLSATLPSKMKQELADSFRQGLDAAYSIPTEPVSQAYPLLTQVSSQGTECVPVTTSDALRHSYEIRFHNDHDCAVQELMAAARLDRAVCWIRNTVADARETFQLLRSHYPSLKVNLFHARMAMCDRLSVEQECLEKFGPVSTARQRRGQILIATQVVEQSLDLDFDTMVSDLAPIDLIIQRSGRVCRHPRDTAGNRIAERDQRGTPILHVFGPQFAADPQQNWYQELLPRASFVYKNVGQLWLTARLLHRHKRLVMPDNARDWIETVYCDQPEGEVPDSLIQATLAQTGETKGDASLAMLNCINLEGGYTATGFDTSWTEDDVAPTRLGEASIIVFLARWNGSKLSPWYQGERKDYCWARSSLTMRLAHIAETHPGSEIDTAEVSRCLESLPANGRWGVLLPVIEQDNGHWCGQAKNQAGDIVQFWYQQELGLMTHKEHSNMEGKLSESNS